MRLHKSLSKEQVDVKWRQINNDGAISHAILQHVRMLNYEVNTTYALPVFPFAPPLQVGDVWKRSRVNAPK